MAIDVRYTGDATIRRWTNRDANTVEIICDADKISFAGVISREGDIETLKAQLNMAIQDWRTYRVAKAKSE